MELQRPLLLFLADVPDQLSAKTAAGIVDWRREWCVGQLRLSGCQADVGLPDVNLGAAIAQGAKTLVIGVANGGGVLPDQWISSIVAAIEAGLDVASGLHVKLEEIAGIREAANRCNRRLINVRIPAQTFEVGNGLKRRGKRLLTVGTDCCVGKKYTALALEREMRTRGMDVTFRATGQTGIFISGRGVAIDAVVSDFVSGAAEWISPGADSDEHWDIIEGQGSIFHPSYAGVSLGLLHGSQPDAFVVCHEPTRLTMRGVTTPIPSIRSVIEMTIACGQVTNQAIRCVGISVNTQALDGTGARHLIEELKKNYQLPVTDPVRFGVMEICDKL